jgi:hypothetical protein
MMKPGQIIVSTLIIVSVILISGCINSQHYQKDNISFNYPVNWKAGYIYDLPGALVGISESSQVDVKIFKYKTPQDSGLKEVYYQSVNNHSTNLAKYCYQQVSNKTMSVDGTTAYELIYQIGCNSTQTRQKIREVWLEKNGYIYTIVCTVIPPEDFPSKNIAFEEIITSFHVN